MPAKVHNAFKRAIRDRRRITEDYGASEQQESVTTRQHKHFNLILQASCETLRKAAARFPTAHLSETRAEVNAPGQYDVLQTLDNDTSYFDGTQLDDFTDPEPDLAPLKYCFESDTTLMGHVRLEAHLGELDAILAHCRTIWQAVAVGDPDMPLTMAGWLTTNAWHCMLSTTNRIFADSSEAYKVESARIRSNLSKESMDRKIMDAIEKCDGGPSFKAFLSNVELITQYQRTVEDRLTHSTDTFSASSFCDVFHHYESLLSVTHDIEQPSNAPNLKTISKEKKTVVRSLLPQLYDTQAQFVLSEHLGWALQSKSRLKYLVQGIGLELLVQTSQAFFWVGARRVGTHTATRSLAAARETRDAYISLLWFLDTADILSPEVKVAIVKNLQSCRKVLEDWPHSTATLLEQLPWFAVMQMTELRHEASMLALDLLDEDCLVGTLLHLYNMMHQTDLNCNIPILEALCETLNTAVHLGNRPLANFTSIFYSFRGGRILPGPDGQYHCMPKSGFETKKRFAQGISMLYQHPHPNIHQDGLKEMDPAFLQWLTQQKITYEKDTRTQAKIQRGIQATRGVELCELFKAAATEEFVNDNLPIARLNLLAVFELCAALFAAIARRCTEAMVGASSEHVRCACAKCGLSFAAMAFEEVFVISRRAEHTGIEPSFAGNGLFKLLKDVMMEVCEEWETKDLLWEHF